MEHCYYELKVAPDFSLNKYASLSETGPSGVLVQHHAFWRQLNQWGKLFNGSIHFIYEFNPVKSKSQRLKLVIRFDAPDKQALISIQQIMKASILAPYYDQLKLTDEKCLSKFNYSCQVNLLKKERFVTPVSSEEPPFYIASEWKMNSNARLYTMLRLMETMNSHCAYCVDIYPVDYGDTIENSLLYILPHLRELNSFKVKTSANSVSSAGRDENAKKVLDFYENLMDEMSSSPHFLMNIQVLGETEAQAKQVLDAAASEALAEGNHTLYGEHLDYNVFQATSGGFICLSDPASPDNFAYLPHLLTLEQMVPFAVFPVLFPGESIEMPKETVPKAEQGMLIGKDEQEHEIYFPWENLSKHSFLAGMPGSGKTNTMMYLISEIRKAGIPTLIMEPAKKEYRVLTTLEGMTDMSLFSPCANSIFPIHINPFEFPKKMKLADHINRLLDVFNGTFQLDPPMPMLLTEGIQNCYEELMWLPGMTNLGKLKYPTMSMLYAQIEKLLNKYKYAPEVKSNLQSVLQVRIGSLLAREMGDIFDVERSTFPPEEWVKKSAVMELAALGTAPSNFMILMLMTFIRETLDIEVFDPEATKGKPRHMIFLEEAHNLIANTSVQVPGGLDPKVSATAYITKMLAEVRALGEGIIIADQLPTAMAPEVVKNTSLKFGHRLTSQDEREILGTTMSADVVQMERMGIFTRGHALVSYEGLLKPFEIQIPEFKGNTFLDDIKLLDFSLNNPIYIGNILESTKIMCAKFKEQEKQLQEYQKAVNSVLAKKEKENTLKISTKEKEISGLMKRWNRLDLDISLYISGIMQIALRLKSINPNSVDKYMSVSRKLNECFELLDVASKSIRANRDWFIEQLETDCKYLCNENAQFNKQKELINDMLLG